MARKAYLFSGAPNMNLSGAANTYYFSPAHTFMANTQTVEASSEVECEFDATIRNLSVEVDTNSKATDTVYTLRKNGADTALTVTVPASTNGRFQDTTNSVTVTTGDLIAWQVATGGTGNHFCRAIYAEIEADSGNAGTYFMERQGFSTGTNTTFGQQLGGTNNGYNSGGAALTSIGSRQWMPCGGVFSHLRCVVNTNTKASGNCLIQLAVNAAAGNSVVTIPFGTTGTFEDTSNTDTVSEGDSIGWMVVTTGSGTLGVTNIQCTFRGTQDATPMFAGQGFAQGTGTSGFVFLMTNRNNQTEAEAQIEALFDCTLSNLYVRSSFAGAGVEHEVRVNGANSGMRADSTTSGAETVSDLSTDVAVVAGDLICVNQRNNSGSTQGAAYEQSVGVFNPFTPPAASGRRLGLVAAA